MRPRGSPRRRPSRRGLGRSIEFVGSRARLLSPIFLIRLGWNRLGVGRLRVLGSTTVRGPSCDEGWRRAVARSASALGSRGRGAHAQPARLRSSVESAGLLRKSARRMDLQHDCSDHLVEPERGSDLATGYLVAPRCRGRSLGHSFDCESCVLGSDRRNRSRQDHEFYARGAPLDIGGGSDTGASRGRVWALRLHRRARQRGLDSRGQRPWRLVKCSARVEWPMVSVEFSVCHCRRQFLGPVCTVDDAP
jgi:hypothetical protein